MAIPNFLFYSVTPGTGKTTYGKAIINELGCDALFINSSDDRKIETIREKVKTFAMTKSSNPNVKRCVFMDEADGMWGVAKASQDALRTIMEQYASNVFFIFTCNNINKIIEPIKSRCVPIPLSYPDKKEIKKYLEDICTKENMNWSDEGIDLLIDKNYPSIRNCVLALQDLYTQKKDVVPENISSVDELYEDIWKMQKEKKWNEIKNIIISTNLDARDLNTFFWKKSLDEEGQNRMIQITCRNERDISLGADAKIIFITSLVEMMKS